MTKMTASPLATPEPTGCGQARPYHHGDLHRALIEAARTIVERDGAQALSLRAVAREAGVSPAAPYHHFKDKQELMGAVGAMGFDDLGAAMAGVIQRTDLSPGERLTEIGVAYVTFALANPSIYRIMYDCARDMESLPMDKSKNEHDAYAMVRTTVIEAGIAPAAEIAAVETATISLWCSAHGVAEMVAFPQFAPLREGVGGQQAFIRALLKHVGFARRA